MEMNRGNDPRTINNENDIHSLRVLMEMRKGKERLSQRFLKSVNRR